MNRLNGWYTNDDPMKIRSGHPHFPYLCKNFQYSLSFTKSRLYVSWNSGWRFSISLQGGKSTSLSKEGGLPASMQPMLIVMAPAFEVVNWRPALVYWLYKFSQLSSSKGMTQARNVHPNEGKQSCRRSDKIMMEQISTAPRGKETRRLW